MLSTSCSGSKGGGAVDGLDGIPTDRPVVKALISAREVDVTGDDNSLLPDRLGLQDVVYVITNPRGGNRKGWVKISRSPSDTEGFGWVERKNIRILTNYTQAGAGASLPANEGFSDAPPIEESGFDAGQAPPPADEFSDGGLDDGFDTGQESGFDDFSDEGGSFDDGGAASEGSEGSGGSGEEDLFSEEDLFGDE
ncbi:MAG TPA: hypothetical protein PKC21_05415 [Oligoflexia bacterium]|nr:hypothetical protein [Oligoflexia bacterium]